MCELIHSLAQILTILASIDILLSRFNFDLAHKVGFGKFSYIAPYAFVCLAVYLLIQTGDQCSGLFGTWN
jgi:uncharacterized membrane protein YuzA (DUF378 family)|tara:strand:+ start:145 stop:354 length:210 start_codon:yes stop_codon:yes gene_type:complete